MVQHFNSLFFFDSRLFSFLRREKSFLGIFLNGKHPNQNSFLENSQSSSTRAVRKSTRVFDLEHIKRKRRKKRVFLVHGKKHQMGLKWSDKADTNVCGKFMCVDTQKNCKIKRINITNMRDGSWFVKIRKVK